MYSFLKVTIPILLVIIQWYFTIAQAAEYIFIPEHEDILSPCDSPDDKAFGDTFDLSNMQFDFNGDTVEVKGLIRFLWHTGSDENVDLNVATYKKQGSDFVPTFMSIHRRDGCKAIFDPSEFWYDILKHVIDEDQLCITHHDEVVWHWNPFNASLRMRLDAKDAEGTYKIVVKGKSYGPNGLMTNNEMCLTILCQLFLD